MNKLEQVTEEVDHLVDGLGRGIDLGIKKVVIALRFHGFETYMSCEGHMDRALAYPWVDVEGEESLDKINNLLNEFYSNKEKGFTALQIITFGRQGKYQNDFRLQSLNQIGTRDTVLTMVRDQVILNLLRKEMNDFADYLLSKF